MKTALAAALPACLFLLVHCAATDPAEKARRKYFVSEVKPVLEAQCVRCHLGAMPPAGLSLASRNGGAFTPRADGTHFIVPGSPEKSLLLTAVTRSGTHARMMPKLPVSLTDDDIGMLTEWIQDGAHWPSDTAGQLRPRPNPENP